MCVMVPVCFVVEHVACLLVVLRGVSVCLCLLVCAHACGGARSWLCLSRWVSVYFCALLRAGSLAL